MYTTIHFDPDRHEFFRETGIWAILFGLSVSVAALGIWTTREQPAAPPKPPAPGAPPDSTDEP